MTDKKRVKHVIDEVSALGLPDGAHWMMIHERLNLCYGEVFDFIADDPAYFGYAEQPLPTSPGSLSEGGVG